MIWQRNKTLTPPLRDEYSESLESRPEITEEESVREPSLPELAAESRSNLVQSRATLASQKSSVQERKHDNSNQRIMERLIEELDRKNEAIHKIGQDLIILRKRSSDQDSTIRGLRERLEESDLKTKRLIQAFDLDIIPHEELKRRYGLLANKLEQSLERLKRATERIETLERFEFEKEKVLKDEIDDSFPRRIRHSVRRILPNKLSFWIYKRQYRKHKSSNLSFKNKRQ
jgi:hypothetical protein